MNQAQRTAQAAVSNARDTARQALSNPAWRAALAAAAARIALLRATAGALLRTIGARIAAAMATTGAGITAATTIGAGIAGVLSGCYVTMMRFNWATEAWRNACNALRQCDAQNAMAARMNMPRMCVSRATLSDAELDAHRVYNNHYPAANVCAGGGLLRMVNCDAL